MHDNSNFGDGDKTEDSSETHCLRLVIEGKVQGVGYRDWLKSVCITSEVTGWVRNKSDGTVEAVICGDNKIINNIFEQCYKGPALAKVTKITECFEEVNKSVLGSFRVECSD